MRSQTAARLFWLCLSLAAVAVATTGAACSQAASPQPPASSQTATTPQPPVSSQTAAPPQAPASAQQSTSRSAQASPDDGVESPPDDCEAKFLALDVTEDGYLSGKEAAGYRHVDANGDGRITKEEFLAGCNRGGDSASTAESAFRELDVNEDGRLTGTESRSVRHLDTDGDGKVTQSEFLAGSRDSASTPKAEPDGEAEPPRPHRAPTAWDAKLAAQFDGGRKWAVLIGINKYEEGPLRFCVPDAKLIGETLVQNCGYDKARVVVLTDDQEDRQLHPRKTNLQHHLLKILKQAGPSDTVLVSFAGHGFSSDGQSFLCPLDFNGGQAKLTGWRIDELRSMLHDCPAAQKILILDCCHSGGSISVGFSGPSGQELGAKFEHAQGLLTLASCRTNETSLESAEKGHGVFTDSMTRGLRGAADFDGNEIIDSDELYRHLLMEVPIAAQEVERGHKQTPVRIIGQDVVGVFALSRPGGEFHEQVKPKGPQPGEVVANSIGMRLVCLPRGVFIMGSALDEYMRKDDEEPTPVVISNTPFLGTHEVTQREYSQVMGTNPSYFSASGAGAAAVESMNTGRFPVEQVSWQEAMEFCRRLSALPEEQAAGRTYRLPTEAEWEYACRANTATAFHVGELLTTAQAHVRGDRPYLSVPKGPFLNRTRTVGSFPPNGFGLHDMHGNVAEWCLDRYTSIPVPRLRSKLQVKAPEDKLLLLEEFLQGLESGLPADRVDPTGPLQGDTRVLRGGSYAGDVVFCRSSARRSYYPEYRHRSSGFRIVCVLQEKQP